MAVGIDGVTYALVASHQDNGMQIIGLDDPENPTPVAGISDGVGGYTQLGGAAGIYLAQVEGNTYAAVSGYRDDGVHAPAVTLPAMSRRCYGPPPDQPILRITPHTTIQCPESD